MKKVRICLEIQGLVQDEHGAPCPGGLCLTIGDEEAPEISGRASIGRRIVVLSHRRSTTGSMGRGIKMLNKIVLMGRLVRDPELRRTGGGTAVAALTLAVDRDYKSQSGEKETDFIDVVAWRSTAEFVNKYFTKGRMAVVEGRLQIRDWTDKDGGRRRSAEVVAASVYFGDSKRTVSDSDTPPSGEFQELPEEAKGELPF